MNHEPLYKLHRLATGPAAGLPKLLLQPPPQITCSGCNEGHHSRAPHNAVAYRPPVGHTIATDLFGPLQPTTEGHQHVLTITEMHTRMRFIVLLKTRAQASNALLDVMKHIEAHTNKRIARVRCDNANEFLTRQVLALDRHHGFDVDPTVPHTPQMNAVAERFNRTLMSRVRATLSSLQLPFAKYWSFCALNTV